MASKAALDLILQMKGDAEKQLKQISRELGNLSREVQRAQRTSQSSLDGIGRSAQQASGFIRNAASSAAGFVAAQVTLRAWDAAIGFVRDSTVGLNGDVEDARATIQAFTKDAALTEQILRAVRTEADKTPYGFNELTRATGALIPTARMANEPLMDLLHTAEILAASNPAEGLEGAAFALKEAVSGDYTSIIERFNLPRVYINQLKEQGLPAIEIVRQAMQSLGYDMDLVTLRAETMRGRWSTFADTLDGIRIRLSQPLFEEIKQGLVDAQAFFDRNKTTIDAWASFLGKKVGQGARLARQALGQLVGSVVNTVKGWVSGFLNMESQTARSIGRILGFLAGLGRSIAGWGSQIVQLIAQGMIAAVGAVVRAINYLGRVIGYWMQPHSPPRFLRNIDAWGRETAQLYLDSWADADASGLGRLADKIEDEIGRVQERLGEIRGLRNNAPRDFTDLPSDERLKRIRELLESPDLSPDRRRDLALQAEEIELRQRLRNLEREKEEAQRRQLDLIRQQAAAMQNVATAVASIAAVAERGLTDNERAIRVLQLQRAELDSVLELRRIEKQLSEGNLTEYQRQSLELQKQALLLERQARAAEAVELGIDPATLSALQNVPIGEADLGPIEDVMSANERNLRWAQMQQDELQDLIELRKLEGIIASDTATAAEKAMAQFQHDAIEAQRALRMEEAQELGFDVGALAALANIPIVLADIEGAARGAAGGAGALEDALAGIGAGGGLGELPAIADEVAGIDWETMLPEGWAEDWDRIWGEFTEGFGEGETAFANFKEEFGDWKMPELKWKWPWETEDGKDPLDGLTALFDDFEWPSLPAFKWPWESASEGFTGDQYAGSARNQVSGLETQLAEAAVGAATAFVSSLQTELSTRLKDVDWVGELLSVDASTLDYDNAADTFARGIGAAIGRRMRGNIQAEGYSLQGFLEPLFSRENLTRDLDSIEAAAKLGAAFTALFIQASDETTFDTAAANLLEGLLGALLSRDIDIAPGRLGFSIGTRIGDSVGGWLKEHPIHLNIWEHIQITPTGRTLPQVEIDWLGILGIYDMEPVEIDWNQIISQASLDIGGFFASALLGWDKVGDAIHEGLVNFFREHPLDFDIGNFIKLKPIALGSGTDGTLAMIDLSNLVPVEINWSAVLSLVNPPSIDWNGVLKPSDLFTAADEIRNTTIPNLIADITTEFDELKTDVPDLLESMMDDGRQAIEDAQQHMEDAAGAVGTAMKDALANAFSGVVGRVRGLLNRLIDHINDGILAFNENNGPLPDVPTIPNIPELARGAYGFKGLAIAGERGFELATQAGGVQALLGPGLYNFSRPTRVYSNRETERMFSRDEDYRGGGTFTREGDVHISIVVHATVNKDADMDRLAYKLGGTVNRKLARTRRNRGR